MDAILALTAIYFAIITATALLESIEKVQHELRARARHVHLTRTNLIFLWEV